jgi:hypothetical protein
MAAILCGIAGAHAAPSPVLMRDDDERRAVVQKSIQRPFFSQSP